MSKHFHSKLFSRAARAALASAAALGVAATLAFASAPAADAVVITGSGTGSNAVVCNSSTHVMTITTYVTPAMDYYANDLPTWVAVHVYSARTGNWMNTAWAPASYSRTSSVALLPGTYYVYFDYAFQTQRGIVYAHEWAGSSGAYPGAYGNQAGYTSLPSCTL